MAFPIPDHLPRRAIPQDISSSILSKIDAATSKTLNSTLAASWLAELDETITSTKERIHDRIQSDLPKFKHQLQSSQSIVSRLQHLTDSVDTLNDVLSNPESGLIPNLMTTLTKHSALAQETANAGVTYEALYHALECRNGYTTVTSLTHLGKLPDAVAGCEGLQKLVEGAPGSLKKAAVMEDVKRKFAAARSRIEEQLSDAYSRSVIVLHMSITVTSPIQVRQSDTLLSLSSILASQSTSSLSNHLTTLRRDLITHFVDHVLQQPCGISLHSSPTEQKLTLIPAPPNTERRSTRLENLSTVFDFLSSHVLPHLPISQSPQFPLSLCKPVTRSILDHLIIPSLPSSFGLLPSFLELLKHAVAFEDKFIVGLLQGDRHDRAIKTWSDGVCGHYERHRRVEILESARSMAIDPIDLTDTFQAEIALVPESPLPIVNQPDGDFEQDAWGFEDEESVGPEGTGASNDVENGWGFDDDVEPDVEESANSELLPIPDALPAETGHMNGDEESDPADAWGWNDEESLPPEEEYVWDPWSDPPESSTLPDPPKPVSAPPKAATRLEKQAAKHKKPLNGNSFTKSPPMPSSTLPPPQHAVPPTSELQKSVKPPTPHVAPKHQTPNHAKPPIPKETYIVSGRLKRLVRRVEDVINEGKQFAASSLFSTSQGSSPPGTILFQSASSILELYQALYPVKFRKEVESPERSMRYSNDCFYLSEQIGKLEKEAIGQPLLMERLNECSRHLKVISDSWFYDTINRHCQALDEVLVKGAQAFAYTGEQDRYDECETAVNDTLRNVKQLASKLQRVLPKSKFYIALGLVTDAALSRVLRDIIALPDIPEVESHRLSELCRILNSLEGIFSEDPTQPSFVVAYVPSWLKFSYLSELLEASLADITYLFEQGALVDFEVDELVRLVRALFADTPLRSNTINKLLGGHPISSG